MQTLLDILRRLEVPCDWWTAGASDPKAKSYINMQSRLDC